MGKWWWGGGVFPHLILFLALFLLCIVRRQPVACQGLPGHLTCSQSASQKPLLCSVPCQTWCFRPLVWLHVWRGSVTMRSSCWWHLRVTSHSLPGAFQGRWRGAAAFGVVQPSSAAGSLLPALPGLCLPPVERNARVSVPVFLFPQFNELVTP